MPFKSNRLSRRNGNRAMNKRPVITGHDLDAIRVRGTELPTDLPVNTVVTRRTRLVYTLTAASNSYNITTNLVSLSDSSDYATGSNLRFTNLRPVRVEAWASLGTLTGYTIPPVLHVSDVSGQFFHDAVNPGVDYAHVAIRPSLQSRMTWRAANDTSTVLFQIQLEGLSGTTGNGSLYVDVTFEAN